MLSKLNFPNLSVLLIFMMSWWLQSCLQGEEFQKKTPNNHYMNYAVLDGYEKVQDFEVGKVGTLGNLRVETSEQEITTSLETGKNYMMRLVNKELNYEGILVELYDENGKRLATNFVNNQYYYGWSYKSKEGGKYKIRFVTYEKSKPFQATLSMLKR
jgi:hypothetical protein